MGKKTFKRKINPNQEQANLYDRITYLETKIISKIYKIKKTKNNLTLCHHLQSVQSDVNYDQSTNYHDKYWKEYAMAVTIMQRIQDMENYVQTLESSVGQIQKKFNERQNILNLPALSEVKRNISRHSKCKDLSEKREQNNDVASNSVIVLKKQEEVEPHLINYGRQQNHIFYE